MTPVAGDLVVWHDVTTAQCGVRVYTSRVGVCVLRPIRGRYVVRLADGTIRRPWWWQVRVAR